jgi:DNA primase
MTVPATPPFDLDAIKRTHPLADVLAEAGIELRRLGKDRFRARCPFHDDHEPSFLVDERDGHFHCFGCQAHGDVIDFVRRYHGVSFAEACQHLTTQPIQPPGRQSAVRRGSPERRWDRLTLEQQMVMNTAGALYRHALWREGKALDYARRRGLPDWLIRQCALGYADGHNLESYLRRRSGLRIAQELGLLRKDGTEFLHDRLVVPEMRAGQFVWFIGRSIDDTERAPKYLALPGERPILGYERAAGQREVFLCEGVFDLLTALSWNLPAFSPGGTSLPADRLGFLARARVIYGVLDGDQPGRVAAEACRAMFGNRWRPLSLPEDSDLNDLGRQPDGRATFFALLNAPRQESRLENDRGA